MKKQILLLWVMLLALVACGGSDPVAVDEETGQIDLTSLPRDVDVQTVSQVKDLEEVFLIDVREQWEYDEGHIPGITLIPMSEIQNHMSEIPTDKTVIISCRSGNRSNQVTSLLEQQGFENVHNMSGGILAWERAGYEVAQP